MEEQQKEQILRFLKLVGRKQDNPIVEVQSSISQRIYSVAWDCSRASRKEEQEQKDRLTCLAKSWKMQLWKNNTIGLLHLVIAVKLQRWLNHYIFRCQTSRHAAAPHKKAKREVLLVLVPFISLLKAC